MSEAAGAAPAAPAPTHDDEPERYRLGGELGVGGMGRVRAAYDVRLQREIAIKHARDAGDATAEARLWREARITAELDHPGIIAVLDAGRDSAGAPFYAMRVVHGQGLDERVATATGPRARATLARAVLAATHAIAYAHAHGVVHRDLSPRNVRLGRHGEVVVMDWGLAARADEAACGGVSCGTEGFRPPELASGAPSGPPADVWSLGALVHLVLLGAPPPAHGPPGRGLPAPARALLARALADDPGQRYADAGALALDLAALLDGEPVRAHREGVRDRLTRVIRRHPGALVASAGGFAAVAVVAIVLGTYAGQRADDARRARAEAQAALRVMVIDQLGVAVRAERPADIARLAPIARELGALAEARGAEATRAPALRRVTRALVGEAACPALDVRGDGARLCVAADRLWLLAGAGRRAIEGEPGELATARLLGDGGAVLVRDVGGPGRVRRVDGAGATRGAYALAGGVPQVEERNGWVVIAVPDEALALGPGGADRVVRPCPSGVPLRAFAVHPATTAAVMRSVAVCADGTLVIDAGGEAPRLVRSADLLAHLPAAVAATVVGDHLLLGGADGRLALVALEDGALRYATRTAVDDIEAVVAAPHGDVLVIGADAVGVWRPQAGAWRGMWPRAGRTVRATTDELLVFGSGVAEAWTLTGADTAPRVSALGGLGAVAWSPDGAVVAFGAGDGVVHALSPADGRVRRTRVAGPVIKGLAFDGTGANLAVGASSDGGLHVLDAATLTVRPEVVAEAPLRVRRLAFVTPDVIAGFTYHAQPSAFDVRTGARVALAPLADAVVDVAAPWPGRVFVLDAQARLWRYDDGRQEALRPAPGVVALAAAAEVLALATAAGEVTLRATATDAARATFTAPGAAVTALALAPGGDRIALGRADGTLELWSVAARAPTLIVRAHDGRVGAVAFDPGGCRLASAGWDAVGRVLDVCAPP